MHHVLDRWPRISRSVGLAGRGMDRAWRGRAVARAGGIRADNEVFFGIDPFAVADHPIPPPGPLLIGAGVLAGGGCIRRQCVANKDRVGAIGVQLAERLVLNREWRDRLAMRKPKSVFEHQSLWRRCDKRVLQELRHRAENSAAVILSEAKDLCKRGPSPSSRLLMNLL